MIRNAAPPFTAAVVGKPQMLPSPMALPAAAKMNAIFEPQTALSAGGGVLVVCIGPPSSVALRYESLLWC